MKCIFLFLALFMIASPVFSQAVIYRKNGEVFTAYNLQHAGKNRSYTIPEDREGVKRYISISVIDSIKYEDGSTEMFSVPNPTEIVREEEEQKFNRLFLGVDIAAILFYDNIKASFEYLPGKGNVGLYAAYSFNPNDPNVTFYDDYYDYYIYANIMNIMHWNARAGINAYIFPPGSFRLSSGLHWLTGKYTEKLVTYTDKEPYYSTLKKAEKSLNGLFVSPGLNWQLNSFIRITAAVDIGIYLNTDVNRDNIFRTEIVFNF